METTLSRTRSSRARRWAKGWAGILPAAMRRRAIAVGLMLGIVALGVTLGATPALPQSAFSCPPFVCTSFVATFDPPSSTSGDPSQDPILITQPAGINSRGQIVGYMQALGGASHGFIRDAQGNFTPLDYPGAGSTSPAGINDRGQVVLIASTLGGDFLGSFLAQPPYSGSSSFTRITVAVPGTGPGGTDGTPVDPAVAGINSRGQIVGIYNDQNSRQHGFLLDPGGNVTTIDLQNGCNGFKPAGIDESGQVLGRAGIHAVVYAQGACTVIDQPLGKISNFNNFTWPAGINNRGEVVGLYWGTDRKKHGFLLHRDGTVDTIDLPAIHLTGINDPGKITGWFFNGSAYAGLIVSGR